MRAATILHVDWKKILYTQMFGFLWGRAVELCDITWWTAGAKFKSNSFEFIWCIKFKSTPSPLWRDTHPKTFHCLLDLRLTAWWPCEQWPCDLLYASHAAWSLCLRYLIECVTVLLVYIKVEFVRALRQAQHATPPLLFNKPCHSVPLLFLTRSLRFSYILFQSTRFTTHVAYMYCVTAGP